MRLRGLVQLLGADERGLLPPGALRLVGQGHDLVDLGRGALRDLAERLLPVAGSMHRKDRLGGALAGTSLPRSRSCSAGRIPYLRPRPAPLQRPRRTPPRASCAEGFSRSVSKQSAFRPRWPLRLVRSNDRGVPRTAMSRARHGVLPQPGTPPSSGAGRVRTFVWPTAASRRSWWRGCPHGRRRSTEASRPAGWSWSPSCSPCRRVRRSEQDGEGTGGGVPRHRGARGIGRPAEGGRRRDVVGRLERDDAER